MKINKTVHISDIRQLITKDQQDSIKRYSVDPQQQHYNITLTLHDARNITHLQRKKIYSLLGDIAIHITGYRDTLTMEYYKMVFKSMAHEFGMINDNRNFSFINCNVEEANNMIELILKIMFEYRISMEYETSKMLKDEFIYNFMCVKNRVCQSCGAVGADIHHALDDRIQSGHDRKKVNHIGRKVLSLCRSCHTRLHNKNEKEFIKKNKLMPIKLTKELIRELKL